jgi:small conductance mechanosensitive channel
VRTLVPLARQAIRVIVSVIAAIMILSQTGVNTGPILAGVGVLGLAIGFGAQTLVKDIITGIFMLLEDTLAVGDVVSVNGTSGQVEAINIRTMRVRDGAGSVHTIPYSSVATVTNMTKDFSRFVVEAAVGYSEDVDKVIATLKEIGESLCKDPDFGKDILAPIEIMGLDRFDESAVVIKASLTTKPSRQWRIGREFNRRMKKLFDERGIEIPFPHRTVYVKELKNESAPEVQVAKEAQTS